VKDKGKSAFEVADQHATLCGMKSPAVTALHRRRLGIHGPEVTIIGLGCMGMSEFYSPSHMNDRESIRVIHHYLDAGGSFLDTADMYGTGRN